MMNSVFFFRGAVGAFNTKYFFPLNYLRSAIFPPIIWHIAVVMWRERQPVRWERTVAPRRAGTKGKGSIRPLCSGGGAIAHNNYINATHPCVPD